MTEAYWGTTNIKVASAVAAFGAKPRKLDPVTRVILDDGSTRATFWFETGKGAEAKAEMERTWADMQSDEESPIRYVRAALENRETFLGLLKKAVQIKVVQSGGQTLLISENATSEQRRAILKHI